MQTATIGSAVRFFREARGMTQKELASSANVSATAVVKIEHGQQPPSLEETFAFTEALSVSADELLSHKAPQTSFAEAFRQKGFAEEHISDIKRIDLLVDALCAQEEIRQIF